MRCLPALGLLVELVALAPACGRSSKNVAAPGEQLVARVGQGAVTARELEERLRAVMGPGAAGDPAALAEKKAKVLEDLLRLEAAAEEARRRGYDRDPQIQRTLKQQLVAKLMREEVDGKLNAEAIPDGEVERYHQEHAAEFQRADEVRASAIFLANEAAAKKVAAQAKAARVKNDPLKDARAFRDLVLAHSTDETSKQRGGDLAFFDRRTAMYPSELVTAAFALGEVGQVSEAVKTPKGFAVLKLTHKRPGFVRPMEEMRPVIRQRLLHDQRRKRTEELMQSLRAKADVKIDEKALAEVGRNPGPAQPTRTAGK